DTEVNRLRGCDLSVLRRYTGGHGRLYRRWAATRLLPVYAGRFCLLNRLTPEWLPADRRESDAHWRPLDRSRSLAAYTPLLELPSPRRLQTWRQNWAPLFGHYRLADGSVRALREIAAVCRRERIGLVLLCLPEGSAFRGWCPPEVWARTDEVLHRLGREFDVPVVDARGWMDEADFFDGFHLSAEGAARFSERLGRAALPPLLKGISRSSPAP